MIPDKETRCTVMGLGRFGGGLGVTRWLLDRGCPVTLTDLADEDALSAPLEQLSDATASGQLRLQLGSHEPRDFIDTDLVIANPAVPLPWNNPFLDLARENGTPITTEISLLVRQLDRRRIIGVTGTNGKSTTASMIHHTLNANAIDSHLGGNIGGSLLDRVDTVGDQTWIVLELSSAMLWWLHEEATNEPGWSPAVAVITNISPNHLDWHGDERHYVMCKEQITRNQLPGDKCLRGDHVSGRATPIPLSIPGRHNQDNAHLAVMAASAATGISPGNAARGLADFTGLPHRLEAIDADGRFFNDSKSTTPEATLLAIDAFSPHHSRVHLIAGGYDKGVSLDSIGSIAGRLAGLYTIGTTGPSLAAMAGRDAVQCHDLRTAVETAMSRMGPEDLLLLSPGCASWDQFPNYEARGEAYRQLVLNHSGIVGSS